MPAAGEIAGHRHRGPTRFGVRLTDFGTRPGSADDPRRMVGRSPGVPWRLIAACRECELALADLTPFIKELIRRVPRRRGSRTSSAGTSLVGRLRGSRAAGLLLAT